VSLHRVGTAHEVLCWAHVSGELTGLPGRIGGPRRGLHPTVGPFWCDLLTHMATMLHLAPLLPTVTAGRAATMPELHRAGICFCAQHCADRCEPAHCPPGTPRCDCWCHAKEARR